MQKLRQDSSDISKTRAIGQPDFSFRHYPPLLTIEINTCSDRGMAVALAIRKRALALFADT